jgi:ubiquinone/menaquinone biosynthesis C-methylase UbiE
VASGKADIDDAPAPMSVAELGRVGFASNAERYERARPGYPEALPALLVDDGLLGPGRRVADVAAGTGKLTRLLAETGARCVAVEPSGAMGAALRQAVPGVPVVAGVAEALPLASGTVELVTVAQAFHWFDAARALEEMARVLAADGSVVLVWNRRDQSVPWVAELGALLRAGGIPGHEPSTILDALRAAPRFGGIRHVVLEQVQSLSVEDVCDLVASRSWVNVLADDDRARLLGQVAAVVAPLPQPIQLPYRTDVFLARKAP